MQILNNLLIDHDGNLREQQPEDKERCLCHTARMRNEYDNSDTLMQFATNLTPELRQIFAKEKFAQWMEWYLAPEYELPYDSEQLHYDVVQIINSVDMQDWWWSEWRTFDLNLSEWILECFSSYITTFNKKHPSGVARILATQRAVEDYFSVHDQKFNLKSKQFYDIEMSYSQAIAKAK